MYIFIPAAFYLCTYVACAQESLQNSLYCPKVVTTCSNDTPAVEKTCFKDSIPESRRLRRVKSFYYDVEYTPDGKIIPPMRIGDAC